MIWLLDGARMNIKKLQERKKILQGIANDIKNGKRQIDENNTGTKLLCQMRGSEAV